VLIWLLKSAHQNILEETLGALGSICDQT